MVITEYTSVCAVVEDDDDVEQQIERLRGRHAVEPAVDEVLVTKLRRRGHDVHRLLTMDQIRTRLNTFLARRLDGPFTVSELARLPGGASKQQFRFNLAWTSGQQIRRDQMVLRMNPPASVVETHRIREFQLLRAIEHVMPVPHAYWATQERAELGEPAMVCGLARGVAAPTKGARKASGLGTVYGRGLREKLAPQFVAHLAALHTLEPAEFSLDAFQMPRIGTTQSVDWQLGLWDWVWEQDSFEPHPTITLAHQWLWDNRPPIDRVSIVHGDYRNGNFLFDEKTGEITAILDWELTYLGDRHHDLAYAMLDAWGHVDDSGRFFRSGLVESETFIADYQRLTGLSIDPDRLRYYTVLNLYWLVIACTATGVRIAADQMTHLDVMMNFLSGLGAALVPALNRVLEGA